MPFVLLGLSAALLAAVPAIADPSVEQKQSEARSVLAQIQQLDSRMGKAVESYNLANVKLVKIRKSLKENAYELAVARSNLKIGQQRIARRVVDLYTNGSDGGTVEVILGAENLDDLLSRLDTVDRVTNLDTKVVRDVRTFRRATQTHARLLREARKVQEQVVAQRAREKAAVESQLGERQRLLSSIKGEIARMQAAEQRRQLQLARQARARLQVLRTARQATGSEPLAGVSADTSGGTTDEPESAPPPAQYGGVVGIAMRYLGVNYVWGGASPSGFDCSGLVTYVFAQVGVSLPHSSYALYGVGSPVSRDQLQPGDLVFFDGLGHVGIYIGGGQFIHAPHTGDVVKISSLGESWYASTYVGARRVT
ncbi:MAG TPA: NlpC/P60 family protein [Gaiellaceae bacterium]|nr:NlpC/P60 family protein [Gaiellaceae bacterium]